MFITPKAVLAATDHGLPKVRVKASKGNAQILLDRMEKPDDRVRSTVAGNKCRGIYLRTRLTTSGSSKMYHSCAIKIFGSLKDPKEYMMRTDSKLWLHCHCPFFLYYCEQALVKYKASSKYECDFTKRRPEREKQRNPNLAPWICKHLYVSILTMMRMEAGKSSYKEFQNKKNPYDGDYWNKMDPSYKR